MSAASHTDLQLQVIFEDDYVKAKVDEGHKFIFVEWLRHPGTIEFRKLFKKLTDFTRTHKIEYWLSDARAIHYLEFSDQNWLLQHIVPLLKTTTLKKFARVTTTEGLALMDVTRIYSGIEQRTDLGVKTEFDMFLTPEAALDWLFPDAS